MRHLLLLSVLFFGMTAPAQENPKSKRVAEKVSETPKKKWFRKIETRKLEAKPEVKKGDSIASE